MDGNEVVETVLSILELLGDIRMQMPKDSGYNAIEEAGVLIEQAIDRLEAIVRGPSVK